MALSCISCQVNAALNCYFFNDPVNELYLLFVHGTLQMFQKAILKLESDYISSSEASHAYFELVVKLEDRKT